MKINTTGLFQSSPAPKRRTISLFGLSLVLFLLIISLGGCRFGRQARPTPTPFVLFQTDGTPTAPTSDYQVELGDVVLYEKFTGKIEMDVEEDLFFGRSGRVSDIYIQSGDTVEEGQLIATLDNTFLDIDLEIAQMTSKLRADELEWQTQNRQDSIETAQLSLDNARLALQPLLEQFQNDPTSVPSTTLQIRQNQVRLAEIQLERAGRQVNPQYNLQVRLAELRLLETEENSRQSKLVAPFAGEVRFIRLYEDGRPQSISAYQTVAQIVDPTTFKVEANLVPRQLERLAEGLQVEMSRQTRPDQVIMGEIRDLPQPFGNGVSPLVQITVDNPSQYVGLRPGSAVQIQVEVDRKESVAWLPREAVSGFGESYTVLLQDGNSTREVNIEVGMQTDEQVEILGGLEVGDLVEQR